MNLQESENSLEPGAVPPLHYPPGSDVLMDSWVDVNSSIVFLAGSPCDVIRMPVDEWIELVNPRTGLISQRVESPAAAGFGVLRLKRNVHASHDRTEIVG